MNLLHYFWPDNIISRALVLVLFSTFGYWIWYFIKLFNKFRKLSRQLDSCRDVTILKNTQYKLLNTINQTDKKKNNSSELEPTLDRNTLFEQFCIENGIVGTPIAGHLKTIYDAGFTDNRLEIGKLLKSTTNALFHENNFLRGILSSFIILGLLGTLFGLANSLAQLPIKELIEAQQAGQANAQINIDVIKGLGGLLSQLKAAFAPSICGVLFTVIGMFLFVLYTHFICTPLKSMVDYLTINVWVPQLFPATTQRLIETLQLSEDQLHKSFDAAEKVAEFAEGIDGRVGVFQRNLDLTNRSMEVLTGSATGIGKVVQTFSQSVNELTSFQQDIKVLYNQLIQESATFRQSVTATLDASVAFQKNSINGHNQQVQTLLQELDSYESTYINKRQQIEIKIEEVLNVAREAFAATSSKDRLFLEETGQLLVHKLDENLGEIGNKLNKGLTEIQTRFSSFDVPIQHASKQIEGSLETVVRRTETIVRELQSTYNSSIEEMDKRLTTLISEYTVRLLQNNQSQQGNLNALNSTLDKLINAITLEVNQRLDSTRTQGPDRITELLDVVVKRNEMLINQVQRIFLDAMTNMNEGMNKQFTDFAAQFSQNRPWQSPEIHALNINLTKLATIISEMNYESKNERNRSRDQVAGTREPGTGKPDGIANQVRKTTSETGTETGKLVKNQSGADEYIRRLVAQYNRVLEIHTDDEYDTFMETYNPVWLDIANKMESGLSFEVRNDGDYLAIDITEYLSEKYLIVPRFKLNFNDTLYDKGTLGKVYKCDGYQSGQRYKSVKLSQPAIFLLEGTHWVLETTGRLRWEREVPAKKGRKR
jgi:archaellum component FlaC